MASIRLNTHRLEYVAGKLSDSTIFETTGLTHSTIDAYKEGKINLSKEGERLLRNLYQRTVYKEARDKGMSSEVAKRVSWQTPETVERRVDRFDTIVEHLTDAGILKKIARKPDRVDEYSTDEYKESLRESIRKGLRKSKTKLADIERYL